MRILFLGDTGDGMTLKNIDLLYNIGVKMENKAFKKAGIKNLLNRNYGMSIDLDLDAEIDDSLTMKENWENIKNRVLL